MNEKTELSLPDYMRFAKLPDAPWIPLEVISSFVRNGWAFNPSFHSLDDISSVPDDGNGNWRREGALLAHISPGFSSSNDPSVDAFDKALTIAGHYGLVRFRAVKSGEHATDILDIPTSYFNHPRLFGDGGVCDQRISGRGANGHRERHWESVTIERNGFLNWLHQEYPAIFLLHEEASQSLNSISDTIADEVGKMIAAAISGRSELIAKWVSDRQNHRSQMDQYFSEFEFIRHDLISAASLGLLTVEQADVLAAKLECGPLLNQPDLDAINSGLESFWTLAMVVAWISRRNFDEVTKKTVKFCKASDHWDEVDNLKLPIGLVIEKSWHIKRNSLPSIYNMMLEDSCSTDEKHQMTADQAKANLWCALQDGAFFANGKKHGEGRQEIAAMLWQDLILVPDGNSGREYLCEGQSSVRWDGVTVKRDDVFRIWPPKIPEAAKHRASVNTEQRGYQSNPGRRSKVASVVEAIRCIWPNGVPNGVVQASRDNSIYKWLAENGRSKVSPRTIQTAIQTLKH